jgi:hypothetical protein
MDVLTRLPTEIEDARSGRDDLNPARRWLLPPRLEWLSTCLNA